jgi:hypothetical protein
VDALLNHNRYHSRNAMMPPDLEMEIVNEYGPNSLMLKAGEDHVLLSVVEVDELIEKLSVVRSDMLPATSVEPSRKHQYVIETTPLWQAMRNPLIDGLIIFLRHSGYGWTGFGIPRASIERLVELMAPLVTPPAHAPASRLYM